MVALIRIAVQLLPDAAGFAVLLFRPNQSVEAEKLFLRRQLGLFKERGIKPRRVDVATRISLAILARLFNWRDALYVVHPRLALQPRHVDVQIHPVNSLKFQVTCSLRISATLRGMLIPGSGWPRSFGTQCQPCAAQSQELPRQLLWSTGAAQL